MMNEGKTKNSGNPPFAFLTRLVPLLVIIVLLMLLVPQLWKKRSSTEDHSYVDPPVAAKVFNTGHTGIDSLLNLGVRRFGAGDYDEAARLLSKGYFFVKVKISEKEITHFPDDLRFYLGLAHFYRGQSAKGVPFLEEEAMYDPNDDRYPWYLAHLYLSSGSPEKAVEKLEEVARLGGPFARAAGDKLKELEEAGIP